MKTSLVEKIKKYYKYCVPPLIVAGAITLAILSVKGCCQELEYKHKLGEEFKQEIAGEDKVIDFKNELMPVLEKMGYKGTTSENEPVRIQVGKGNEIEEYREYSGKVIVIPKNKVEEYLGKGQ